MNKNVHLVSLGCPKNRVDSEVALTALAKAGLCPVADEKTADILLVNTCGFIEDAKEESIDVILELAQIKKERPGARLAVMGCLTERYREELVEAVPEIDHIFGVAELPEILSQLAPDAPSPPDPDSFERIVTTAPHWAYLKIADGCSNRCSFCIIPSIRGQYKSRAIDDVTKEARALAQSGIKELILVAQDTTLFGADHKMKNGLARLLSELENVEGVLWIRVMYLYPALIDDQLLDVFSESKKIVPYFDIPLQHASDTVLKRMMRPETNASIRELLRKIRSRVKGAAIRTSFIVGFPGETEDDFTQLLDLVRDMRFENMGAFTFSPEEGTAAYDLTDRVDENTVKRRYNELMVLQRSIAKEMSQKRIGDVVEVIADEHDPVDNLLTARLSTQAPDIDGSVILDGIEARPGDIIKVRITGATEYDLVGEAL